MSLPSEAQLMGDYLPRKKRQRVKWTETEKEKATERDMEKKETEVNTMFRFL